jgi:hypothetical protein
MLVAVSFTVPVYVTSFIVQLTFCPFNSPVRPPLDVSESPPLSDQQLAAFSFLPPYGLHFFTCEWSLLCVPLLCVSASAPP